LYKSNSHTVAVGSVKRRRARPTRHIVNAFLFLALLIALVLLVDLRDVASALAGIPAGLLALVLIVLSADRVAMGFKWRHLLNGAGGRMRLRDAVAIYYQSGFAALILPTSVAGEVLRGILARRAGVPVPLALASMVLEKLIAAVSSIVLAGFAAVYIILVTSGSDDLILLLILSSTAIVGALAFLSINRRAHEWIGGRVRRWIPERAFQMLDRFSAHLVAYQHKRAVLSANFFLNMGEHVLQFLALYLLARGLGIDFGLLTFLAVTALAMLARRTLGFLESWGLAESAVVVIYSLFGVPGELSVGLAFSLWVTSIVATLPGAYLLYHNGLGFLLSQVTRSAAAEPWPAAKT
jgi:uncharacterized protein (TIRG00374 family)